MSAETEIRIGSEFVGYRIDGLIGRGGMGVVYRAYDLRLKRTVALKLMSPELATDHQFRERFSREAELAMSLEHPNVVPIHDAGDIDGRLYLAMRHVEGTDLRALLRAEGALEPARAVAICSQVANALDAAHADGLVHRDVKPSNVLLDANEHVYLADFGLTRRLDEQSGPAGEGRFVGTPAYLAPEQIEGGSVDGRTDLYSLGCLLYECLTGEIPFARGSPLAVAWAHLEEEPPRASQRRSDLPEALDGVFSRALAKEPQERYPTCGALISAVEEALGFQKTRLFAGRRSLVLATVGLVAIVVAAGTVAFAFVPGGGHGKVIAPLYADGDTLARIDPATNKVSAVVDVGADPVAVAAGGRSVWVYNRDGGTISEVDTGTNRVLKTTPVASRPPDQCCGLFSGPVLAADASGAWFVNGGGHGKALLTRLLADGRGVRDYPLDLTPTGVAVGDGAAWVVGHGAHDYQVLRVDPATGRETAETRFRAPARVASIAFGYGAVWVVSPSSATLYRIDPRSTRVQSLVLGTPSASRPEIMPRGGDLWVKVTAGGGTTFRIDPAPLGVVYSEHDGPPSWEEDRAALGALWWYDWPTGAVYRQEAAGAPIRTIHVTQPLPTAGGPCLTSMTVGSGSLWVTVAPLPINRFACER